MVALHQHSSRGATAAAAAARERKAGAGGGRGEGGKQRRCAKKIGKRGRGRRRRRGRMIGEGQVWRRGESLRGRVGVLQCSRGALRCCSAGGNRLAAGGAVNDGYEQGV